MKLIITNLMQDKVVEFIYDEIFYDYPCFNFHNKNDVGLYYKYNAVGGYHLQAGDHWELIK